MNFDFTVLNTDRGTVPLPSGITVHPSQVCFLAVITLYFSFVPIRVSVKHEMSLS